MISTSLKLSSELVEVKQGYLYNLFHICSTLSLSFISNVSLKIYIFLPPLYSLYEVLAKYTGR